LAWRARSEREIQKEGPQNDRERKKKKKSRVRNAFRVPVGRKQVLKKKGWKNPSEESGGREKKKNPAGEGESRPTGP